MQDIHQCTIRTQRDQQECLEPDGDVEEQLPLEQDLLALPADGRDVGHQEPRRVRAVHLGPVHQQTRTVLLQWTTLGS